MNERARRDKQWDDLVEYWYRRTKAADEELDKIADDYNALALELCAAEFNAYNLELEVAEARGIAGELFAYLRLIVRPGIVPRDAYVRIRPGVRKRLEGK